jgi:hypothetical protein
MPQATIPGSKGSVEPTEEDRRAFLALVRRVGEARAASHLGTDRFGLARLVGTLPVRASTLTIARQRVALPCAPERQTGLDFGAAPAAAGKAA